MLRSTRPPNSRSATPARASRSRTCSAGARVEGAGAVEHGEIDPLEGLLNPRGRLRHVLKPGANSPLGHSKNLNGAVFDAGAQRRMQASPTHDVGLGPENLSHALLQLGQLDEAEAGVIEVEEQIDVAGGAGLAARHGAEQVQARDSKTTKFVSMTSQGR